MPDEAPVMTATRPVAESVLMVVLLAKSGWADTHCAPDRGRLRGPTRGGPAGPLTRSVRGLRWLLPPVGMPLPRLPGNDEHDRERRQRHRRVPRQPTREDLARAGRAAQLRPATGAGAAPRGGRLAGRRQRRLLPPPGTRPGQRRLRARARSARA